MRLFKTLKILLLANVAIIVVFIFLPALLISDISVLESILETLNNND
ncbi:MULTISPECIES: hypothetical protein [Bacillaceae]|nr:MULTISPECIES: hypothetical protein [Bacillaceae]MDX8366079.1 hypothetical protein [Cytobacillus sp. IB215665]